MRDGQVRSDLAAGPAPAIEAPDWRTLDRDALGLALNNAAAVPDSADIIAAWDERSQAVRAEGGHVLDFAYGPRPRNRIDLIRARGGRATLVFVHGGYWQFRAKELFAFLAAGPAAHGINLALVGYTLAPEATLDEMAREVAAALDCLAAELARHDLDPAALWLSGWSAGGHLAATALGHPAVRGAILISGIYDLEPIRHCWINDTLCLDAASAARNSPIARPPASSPPVLVVAGSAELPLMRVQSRDYAAALIRANHFTILEDMARPDGRLCRLIAGMTGPSP